MKKLFVLAVALVVSTAAFSQAQVSIGLKAGPNFAKIDTEGTASSNYKNRTGFHGGAFVLVKLTKIGIQPEILFSQQGSKVTIDSKDLEANFSYLNIPVIFKLYTVGGINLQVGPQFGFLSSSEIQQIDTSSGSVETIKDGIKKSDMSVAVGLGWDLPFGLSVDGRYNIGLSNVAEDTSTEIRNQVWQLSLGYKLFKFGK